VKPTLRPRRVRNFHSADFPAVTVGVRARSYPARWPNTVRWWSLDFELAHKQGANNDGRPVNQSGRVWRRDAEFDRIFAWGHTLDICGSSFSNQRRCDTSFFHTHDLCAPVNPRNSTGTYTAKSKMHVRSHCRVSTAFLVNFVLEISNLWSLQACHRLNAQDIATFELVFHSCVQVLELYSESCRHTERYHTLAYFL